MEIETNDKILKRLGTLFLNYSDLGISKERYTELNLGTAQPTPDEIDILYDLIINRTKVTEAEAEAFMDEWLD